MERKDRLGKMIKKGSKMHHITFKDEIPVTEEGLLEGQYDSYEDSESDDGESNRLERERKRKRRREQLHDIIFVESFKEYNASNPNWYQNQCCRLL
jgi:hypothetical protein